MLLLADAVSILVAVGSLVGTGAVHGSQAAWLTSLLPLWLVGAKLAGLYDRDHRFIRHLTTDELSTLLSWSVSGVALSALLLSAVEVRPLSSAVAVAFWLETLLLTAALRATVRRWWRLITPPERAILVGSGPVEAATQRKLELFSDIHMEIAAVVPIEPNSAPGDVSAALQRISTQNRRVDGVVLASQSVSEELIAELVTYCRSARIKLRMAPPARTMFGTAAQLGHVADLPVLTYTTWDVSRTTLLIKRGIDVGVSALVLVVLSPLMSFIAIAIKFGDRGPILFRQQRAGRGEGRFNMFKFRTMVIDAESQLASLVTLDDLDEPVFKLTADPRVTRVGRFLRRWSLDELPQLINVLRGEMSLVGPRPEELALVDRYTPDQQIRLTLKPGLTGPMQIYGRGALRFEERLAVERDYIENFSLGRDIRILIMTIPAIMSGRGAY
ncbi:MAG: sugar transferase [Solirubrobacteraceae bacterium]